MDDSRCHDPRRMEWRTGEASLCPCMFRSLVWPLLQSQASLICHEAEAPSELYLAAGPVPFIHCNGAPTLATVRAHELACCNRHGGAVNSARD